MAYRKIGSIPVGEIVKIQETSDGEFVDFIVVHQGQLGDGTSNDTTYVGDGTWLLRNSIIGSEKWGKMDDSNFFQSPPYTFLKSVYNNFPNDLQAAIKSITVPHTTVGMKYGVRNQKYTAKIFSPSLSELGGYLRYADESGSTFNYFLSDVPLGTDGSYTTRSHMEDNVVTVRHVKINSSGEPVSAAASSYDGLRYVIVLDQSTNVNDSNQVTFNSPPSQPSAITVPETIMGGANATISWSASSDIDGNLAGYELERRWDNTGTWEQVYKGAALSYQDSIPKGAHTSVAYRVRAYDAYDKYSSYTTSPNRIINNNSDPTISGSDSSLGSFGMNAPAAWKYTVNDVDAGDTITVTEAVDGLTKRTFTATRGQEYSLSWTADEWMQVLNGNHTATIKANDGQGGTATRTLTFSKSVTRIEFYLDPPLETDTMPTKALENVVRSIPAGATFRIDLCNNGFDVAPTWEDVTAKVISGDKIFLRNATKTAAKWGYGIHVIVERNGASGECWVSSGAGFFE